MRRNQHYHDRVNRVLDYISEHLDGELSLTRLSGIGCFFPFHFHRIFQGVTGETLNSHVRRVRLERAALLMKTSPRKRITDVALETGFAGTAEFSRAFKNHFDRTASSWDRRSPLEKSKICKAPEMLSFHTVEELHRWKAAAKNVRVRVHRFSAFRYVYSRIYAPYGNTRLVDSYHAHRVARGEAYRHPGCCRHWHVAGRSVHHAFRKLPLRSGHRLPAAAGRHAGRDYPLAGTGGGPLSYRCRHSPNAMGRPYHPRFRLPADCPLPLRRRPGPCGSRLALSVPDLASFGRLRARGSAGDGDVRTASGGNRMGDIRLANLYTRRAALTLVTAAVPAWSQSRKTVQPGGGHMGHPVVHFEIGYRDQAKTERFFADLFGWHIQQTGYPFHSAVAADSGLVGRSPWTARTPPSRCRTRRHE